jgi:hypothetical protein
MCGHLLVTLYWVGLGVESLSLLEEYSKDVLGYKQCKREFRVIRLTIVFSRGGDVFLRRIEGGTNLEECNQPVEYGPEVPWMPRLP